MTGRSPGEHPTVPAYPDGISPGPHGSRDAIVSYCGPARWEIPERLARARRHHARYLAAAREARRGRGRNPFAATGAVAARALANAAWSRATIADLLRYQRALDTMWAERMWYPYREYEARRAALIEAGVLRR